MAKRKQATRQKKVASPRRAMKKSTRSGRAGDSAAPRQELTLERLSPPLFVEFPAGASALDRNNALGQALMGEHAQRDIGTITREQSRWRLE
jgi:hypothetical protein